MNEFFRKFAARSAQVIGSPWAFIAAVTSVVVWAFAGPGMKYSDSWMLICGTFTTIATYLIVFLIQATQNRDARAIQVKLNAVLAALEGASNRLIDLESEADEVVEEIAEEIRAIKEH